MSLQITDPQMRALFHALTGMEWYEADEDKLLAVSEEYLRASKDLRTLQEILLQLAVHVKEGFEGQSADAFVQRIETLLGGKNGQPDFFEASVLSMSELAEFARKISNQVEYTKLSS
ncbi:hypothetical protein AB0D49_33520, partial [Streptomyces sp. NPDC048290]|uniref:WXG100-like domain-containing protein n=1 Tax=Streptomyces sp. NPDC048290 TaxID=3155811 RepID=UPI0034273083